MRELANFSFSVRIAATLRNILDDNSIPAAAEQGFTWKPDTVFTSGNGAYQANRLWYRSGKTLAMSASETLDVFDFAGVDIGAGAGRDAVGQTLALTSIVALMVHVDPASVGELILGNDGTAAAWNSPFNGSDTAELGPIAKDGLAVLWRPDATGFAVADATNHLLKFTEAGVGAVEYHTVILGRV
jgi:hypothetical protein